MTAPQVSTTVLRLLAESAGCEVSDITGDTPLRGGLIDSLDTIDALVDIEEELGIVVSDSEFASALTVGDLLSLCERLVATGRAGR